MSGRIPECAEKDRPSLIAKMEETFVENMKYAANRLQQVMHGRNWKKMFSCWNGWSKLHNFHPNS